MRTLAIDFGERRIGLAVSDPDGRIAIPLTTLTRQNDRQAVRAIRPLIEEHQVERLVIGVPLRLDGSAGDASDRIERFASRLEQTFELPLVRIDEALTSRQARERLREMGTDLRKHPERIDAVAAQILLEEVIGS